jgi:hypothetical protein
MQAHRNLNNRFSHGFKQDFGFVLETWKDLESYIFLLLDEDEQQETDIKELYGEEVWREG